MPEATHPELELDDIQPARCSSGPRRTSALSDVADQDRADGRELVRRLHRIATSSRTSDRDDDTSLTVGFSYHGLEALGVPQASLDSFAPEFREGMAARAGVLGDVGESSPEHWEQPLGSSEVHVAIAALSPDAAGSRQPLSRHGGPTPSCPGWRWSGARTATSWPPVERRSVSRTESDSPRSREAGGRRRVPGAATQGRRDHPGLSGRDRRAAADADAGRPGSQRHLCRLPKAAHQGGGLPALPARAGGDPRGGAAASARRWSGAGRAGLRSPSRRTMTTPSSGQIRGETTTSSSPMTRAGSSARWVPTLAGPTRATPWTGRQRGRAAAPHDPARHQLRADAARG